MGNPKGLRLDFDKLEERRLLGACLLRQGVPQAEVAREVGVHRQSVSRWAQQLEKAEDGRCEGGTRGAQAPPERIRLRRIEQGLRSGPEALGYKPACGPRGAWRI